MKQKRTLKDSFLIKNSRCSSTSLKINIVKNQKHVQNLGNMLPISKSNAYIAALKGNTSLTWKIPSMSISPSAKTMVFSEKKPVVILCYLSRKLIIF